MRELAVAVLLVASGCYTPSFTDCELRCSSKSTCPAGQECDGEFCRAPNASGACGSLVIDSSMGNESTLDDTDGDGVLNATDNCPTMPNREQDNEDGDEYGNACDPCPPFGDPISNMDSDGDGVGNGCDPNGNLIGDSIALFEGFDRMPVQPGFLSTGAVTYSAGHAAAMGSSTSPALLMWPQTDRNRVVSAQITYDALTDSPAMAGVADRYSPSNQGGVACEAGRDQTGLPRLAIIELPGAGAQAQSTAIQLTEGMTRKLSLRRQGSANECAISTGQMLPYNSDTNFGNTDLHAGVRVRGALVQVHWLMIVNSPASP